MCVYGVQKFANSQGFPRLHSDLRTARLCWACLRTSRAQVTASIIGTVAGCLRRRRQDATITVKSLETGATRTVATDDSGNYRVLSLPLGPQELQGGKAGLQVGGAHWRLNLEVGQEAVVNFRLEVGELVTANCVSEEAPVVNVTTASVSGIVDERQIKESAAQRPQLRQSDHPERRRDQLQRDEKPQYQHQQREHVLRGRAADRAKIYFFSTASSTWDRASWPSLPAARAAYLLGIDAVREFNVLTDTYSAEYGKRAGAQVSVVTQSGTNQFHGTIFEFLRNSALDSPGPFDQGIVPPFRRNQFGGAAGGPLQEGSPVSVRQLRRIPAVAEPQQRQRGSRCDLARTGHAAECLHGRVCDRVEVECDHAALHVTFWPAARTDPELMVPATKTACANPPAQRSQRHSQGFLQPQRAHPRRFRHCAHRLQSREGTTRLRAPTRSTTERVSFRWPIRSSPPSRRCACKCSAWRKRTFFRRQILNTATVGFSRASFALGLGSLDFDSRQPFLRVTGSGREASSWAAERRRPPTARSLPRDPTTRRASKITGIFSPTRTTCASATECTSSAWACGSSGFRTMKTARRASLAQAPSRA